MLSAQPHRMRDCHGLALEGETPRGWMRTGVDQGAHMYLMYVAPPPSFAFRLLPMRDSPHLITLGSLVEETGNAMPPDGWTPTRFFGSDPAAIVPCEARAAAARPKGKKGRRKVMCYDAAGTFYNAKGQRPAVVHQYNRFPDLVSRIVGQYRL